MVSQLYEQRKARSIKITKRLVVLVIITAMTSYIGILTSSGPLKIIATSSQVYMLWLSFIVIYKKQKYLNNYVVVPLIVFFVYPIIRIIFESLAEDSFKAISDGLIIQGGYYQLALVGLALALLSKDFEAYDLLKHYSSSFLIYGSVLIFVLLTISTYETVLFGQKIITNFLLPVSVLAIVTHSAKIKLKGLLSLFLIIFVATKISSRSYVIVSLLVSIFIFLTLIQRKQYAQISVFFLMTILAFNFGVFSFLQEDTLIQNKSIIQKFNLESLEERFDDFLTSGDLLVLYYWEGNSRAGILKDAFSNFTFEESLWGKGLFGYYSSFTTRHTIEIGWAQDAFRWGFPYTVFVIGIAGYSIKYLSKLSSSNFEWLKILSCITVIKLLDGFVYGMPEVSFYNLLFMWAIMLPGTKEVIKLKKMPTDVQLEHA